MPQTSRLIIGIRRRTGVISLLAVLGIATLRGTEQRPADQVPQPPEAGTSTIAGTLIDAQSRQPIAGAQVGLSVFANGVRRGATVITGVDGSFAFVDIAEGRYSLSTVPLFGYSPACYPDPERPERCGEIDLLRDQRRTNIIYPLSKAAMARGRVVDHSGAPVPGATVRLGRPLHPRNDIAGVFSGGSSTVTAADGTFALMVTVGEWNIEVDLAWQPGSMRMPTFFYPGVSRADQATTLEFSPGLFLDNLVIVVPAAADNTLTLRVLPGSLAVSDIKVSLISPKPLVVRTIDLDEQGTGTLTAMMEGRYFIEARGSINDESWAAFQVADFIPPTLDLSMQMMPAGRITGRIVSQNGGLPPLGDLSVAAAWTHDGGEINPLATDESRVAEDGSFRIEGLFGKREIRLIGLPAAWRLQSVLQGRTDVTTGVDVPLESTVDITIVVSRK